MEPNLADQGSDLDFFPFPLPTLTAYYLSTTNYFSRGLMFCTSILRPFDLRSLAV